MSCFLNETDNKLKWKFAVLCEKAGKLEKAWTLYYELVNKLEEKGEHEVVMRPGGEHYRLYFNIAQLSTRLWRGKSSEGIDEALIKLSDIISWYRKAIDANPSLVEVYINMSGFLIKQQLSEESVRWATEGITCLEQFHADNMVNSRAHRFSLYTNLNIALRQCDQMEKAIDLTWSAMKLQPVLIDLSSESELNALPPISEKVVFEFVCVKYGSKYNAAYVNCLFRMISETWRSTTTTLSLPRFVCYTEDAIGLHSDIEIRSFDEKTNNWEIWWRKAQVFKPPSPDRRDSNKWLVYLDLDTIVLQSIEPLLEGITKYCDQNASSVANTTLFTLDASKFHNEGKITLTSIISRLPHLQTMPLCNLIGRPRGINSSIMIWKEYAFASLFHHLREHYATVTDYIFKWDHYLEMMLFGMKTTPAGGEEGSCQTNATVVYLQDILPKSFIIDYADYQVLRDESEDQNCAIVCFPLTPKPHDLELMDSKLWRIWKGEVNIDNDQNTQEFTEEVD
jgi:tetratricopeptide (TPR) repeat protein